MRRMWTVTAYPPGVSLPINSGWVTYSQAVAIYEEFERKGWHPMIPRKRKVRTQGDTLEDRLRRFAIARAAGQERAS